MELKIGDKIKYDSSSDSMFSYYGIVEKICPKTVVIKDSESEYRIRIKKTQIVKVY